MFAFVNPTIRGFSPLAKHFIPWPTSHMPPQAITLRAIREPIARPIWLIWPIPTAIAELVQWKWTWIIAIQRCIQNDYYDEMSRRLWINGVWIMELSWIMEKRILSKQKHFEQDCNNDLTLAKNGKRRTPQIEPELGSFARSLRWDRLTWSKANLGHRKSYIRSTHTQMPFPQDFWSERISEQRRVSKRASSEQASTNKHANKRAVPVSGRASGSWFNDSSEN